jgi:hypothetical protein
VSRQDTRKECEAAKLRTVLALALAALDLAGVVPEVRLELAAPLEPVPPVTNRDNRVSSEPCE